MQVKFCEGREIKGRFNSQQGPADIGGGHGGNRNRQDVPCVNGYQQQLYSEGEPS